ncbi:hypothetical protein GCM10022223_38300 [Kineosporia mesophila]|uniref:(2Fe-2S) ferredoxin domain-containing protein n=1 Tax=Kineosporia mesophila TaxID=566012 RepID=A0ABP6ZVL1_9ACTN|nr:hypothetical protein [Kineosporia mesophila]MCD5348458.1 hypothetical protein [Kineosporia mesophila]
MSRERKPRRPGDHLAGRPVPHREHLRERETVGPVVAACTGPRCAALCRMAGTGTPADALNPGLRDATRRTPGGILVSTGCLGRCDLGAVILVAWRFRSPVPVALAGMHEPARLTALTDWLPGPGPRRALFERVLPVGELADAAAEAAGPQLIPPGP